MRLRFAWRSVPPPHAPFGECAGFADWVAGRAMRRLVTVVAHDVDDAGAEAVTVDYHHDGPADWRPDATLRRAMRQLAAMRLHLAPGLPAPVRVDHWAFPEKRALPRRPGDAVGPEHVNGGCTRRGDTIHCFRQEQYPKVWLHEAAHAFGLDHADTPASPARMRALRALLPMPLPPDAPLRPSEAWAELVAEAYSTACLTRSAVGSARWRAAWAKETRHAFEQAGALLRHMGAQWREQTNAMAYYVLKTALMLAPEAWSRVRSGDDLVALLMERLRHPDFVDRLRRGAASKPAKDRNLRMTLRA